MPSGAYIDFRVGEHWINIYLYASSDDWMATRGLCGTFDGDKANDFLFPDGFTKTHAEDNLGCGESPDVCKFANEWRSGRNGGGEIFSVDLITGYVLDEKKITKYI